MERAWVRRAKAGSAQRSLGPWEQGELRAIAWDLKSIGNRLRAAAGWLVGKSNDTDARRARISLEIMQAQLWSLAGELIGMRARLAWFGEGLRSAGQPAGALPVEGDPEESAALLSAIERVRADSLAPAIRVLLQAAGYEPPDGADCSPGECG
jgi:hypothetical protein